MVHILFGANFEGWEKATLYDDYTMEPVLSDTRTHTHTENPMEHYLPHMLASHPWGIRWGGIILG